jgi:hypothetical protein
MAMVLVLVLAGGGIMNYKEMTNEKNEQQYKECKLEC